MAICRFSLRTRTFGREAWSVLATLATGVMAAHLPPPLGDLLFFGVALILGILAARIRCPLCRHPVLLIPNSELSGFPAWAGIWVPWPPRTCRRCAHDFSAPSSPGSAPQPTPARRSVVSGGMRPWTVKRLARIARGLWVMLAVGILAGALWIYDGTPATRDVELLVGYGMLVLSFPASCVLGLVLWVMCDVLEACRLLNLVRTGYFSLVAGWAILFAAGFTQWFILFPRARKRLFERTFNSRVSGGDFPRGRP